MHGQNRLIVHAAQRVGGLLAVLRNKNRLWGMKGNGEEEIKNLNPMCAASVIPPNVRERSAWTLTSVAEAA